MVVHYLFMSHHSVCSVRQASNKSYDRVIKSAEMSQHYLGYTRATDEQSKIMVKVFIPITQLVMMLCINVSSQRRWLFDCPCGQFLSNGDDHISRQKRHPSNRLHSYNSVKKDRMTMTCSVFLKKIAHGWQNSQWVYPTTKALDDLHKDDQRWWNALWVIALLVAAANLVDLSRLSIKSWFTFSSECHIVNCF